MGKRAVITVISVGKLKEKALEEGISYYRKKIEKYHSLSVIQVEDEKCPESLSEKNRQKVMEKEGERILSKIPQGSVICTLEIEGKQWKIKALRDKISTLIEESGENICFIIGGSLGISDQVKEKSHLALSFSQMTFPHQLTKLFLFEVLVELFCQ